MPFRMTDISNFLATSSCTTLTLAARKLGISQPALSESINRLESDANCRLFYRSRSGVELTPGGRAFLNKAQRLMEAYDHLNMKTDPGKVFSGRTIIVGCHATVAQYALPQALTYLKAHAADYNIELTHDLSRNIQSEIQRGRIDVGIVINPTVVPDVVIKRLELDTVGVWSSDHTSNHDTIVCNLNLFQTHAILKKWKKKPSRVLSTSSLELITQLLAENVGFGILPERAAKLSKLPLRHHANLPIYKDEICLVHRPEFGKNAAEKITLEALRQAF